jgi:hypothetical protein
MFDMNFLRPMFWLTMIVAALLAVAGVVAMLTYPSTMAESSTATGSGLWLGAGLGLALFLVAAVLPQFAFALTLRSGQRGWLLATAVVAPLWALVMGFQPLVAAIVTGWGGIVPFLVVSSAVAGVFDLVVMAIAITAIRRWPGRITTA